MALGPPLALWGCEQAVLADVLTRDAGHRPGFRCEVEPLHAERCCCRCNTHIQKMKGKWFCDSRVRYIKKWVSCLEFLYWCVSPIIVFLLFDRFKIHKMWTCCNDKYCLWNWLLFMLYLWNSQFSKTGSFLPILRQELQLRRVVACDNLDKATGLKLWFPLCGMHCLGKLSFLY